MYYDRPPSACLIPFQGVRVKSPKVLWAKSGENRITTEQAAAYCYVNKNCYSMSDIDVDEADEVTLFAERYGGPGVGKNGGGVRCGNIHNVQIKGIGTNPLVGYNEKEKHSNGIYDLHDAAFEVFGSEIYGIILPVGVVHSIALLDIGDSGYEGSGSNEKSKRGVLLREPCLRPAHYLRATDYQTPWFYWAVVPPDVARLRAANKELSNILVDDRGLIKFLLSFLEKTAIQMSFSWVNRICHSGLSASNIAFDGRWLDFSYISFLRNLEDFKGESRLVSFSEERKVAFGFVEYFVRQYSKYVRRTYRSGELREFYDARLEYHSVDALLKYLGLDKINRESNSEYKTSAKELYGFYDNVIKSNLTPSDCTPEGSFCFDNVGHLMHVSFQEIFSGKKLSFFSEKLKALYRNGFSEDCGECFLRYFLIKSVQVLRKELYRDVFYTGNVRRIISKYALLGEREFNTFIDQYKTLTFSIYGSYDNESIVLFNVGAVSICWDSTKDVYLFKCMGVSKIATSHDEVVSVFNESGFVYYDFDIQGKILFLVKYIEEYKLLASTSGSVGRL